MRLQESERQHSTKSPTHLLPKRHPSWQIQVSYKSKSSSKAKAIILTVGKSFLAYIVISFLLHISQRITICLGLCASAYSQIENMLSL